MPINYFLPTLLLFFYATFSQSQVNKIDSRKQALKNAKHDTTRCSLLNELAETAGEVEWPEFNEQLLKIAKEGADAAGTSSLRTFYLKYLASAFNNIGYLTQQQQGDVPKILEYYNKSLKINEEIKNKDGIAYSLHNIGFIYEDQGDIPKALEYYHRSLKISEEIQDKQGMTESLNNMAVIYDLQGDLSKALECYNRCLEINEEIKNKDGIARSLNNIGSVYGIKGDIKKALVYFNKSLNIRKEINDKMGVANSLINLGNMHEKQGNISKALDCFYKSLEIREEVKDKKGIASSLNHIASAMLEKGLVNDALRFASRSLQTARELGYPAHIYRAAATLKLIFQKQSKFKEALEMHELEIFMRDSINSAETRKASLKKQFQYEYDKKEAVVNAVHKGELEKQQAVADEKNRKQKIITGSVVIGLALLLLFAIFVVRSLRITRRQKQLIEIKSRETEEQKIIIEEKHKEVEEKNKNILDSIRYAKRIQISLLPTEKYIERILRQAGKN